MKNKFIIWQVEMIERTQLFPNYGVDADGNLYRLIAGMWKKRGLIPTAEGERFFISVRNNKFSVSPAEIKEQKTKVKFRKETK